MRPRAISAERISNSISRFLEGHDWTFFGLARHKHVNTPSVADRARGSPRFRTDALPEAHVQVDEAWAFVYAKQKNVPEIMKGPFGVGDLWTWVAIDADTKLAASWAVEPTRSFSTWPIASQPACS